MNLPERWTDFKIIEVQPGVFTGRVTTLNQDDIDNWETKGIKELQAFTKEFLEKLLGYKIQEFDKS